MQPAQALALLAFSACSGSRPSTARRAELAPPAAREAPAASVEPQACTDDGWCWENPLPLGAALGGVWAAAPDEVWAVGGLGTVLLWDGTRWASVASRTDANLHAVWGSSSRDVWAVGDEGTVLRWDGRAWSVHATDDGTDLAAVWGSGPRDVWTVGWGAILHFDGARWTRVPNPAQEHALSGVWGSGPDDVWAVGGVNLEGAILHFDGRAWSRVPLQGVPPLHAVWGSSRDDVWTVGDAAAFHFDGRAWTRVEAGTAAQITAVWGSGPDDLWAACLDGVLHFDGSAWSRTPDVGRGALRSFAGAGPDDVWAVGGGWGRAPSAIWRWDGVRWSEWSSGPPDDLQDVWASGGEALAVGGGGVLRREAGRWMRVRTSGANAVWGASPGDVWTVGHEGAIERWNGTAWSPVRSPESGWNRYLFGIVGTAPADLWAVGGGARETSPGVWQSEALGVALHWDGSAWTSVPTGARGTLRGVAAAAVDDVWAAGAGLFHWNGASWTARPVDECEGGIADVWAAGPEDVWGVGACGVVRWDGRSWNLVLRAGYGAQALTDVAGGSGAGVWAMGGTTVVRWDGREWRRIPTARTLEAGSDLAALWPLDAGGALAVGEAGTILRWDERRPHAGARLACAGRRVVVARSREGVRRTVTMRCEGDVAAVSVREEPAGGGAPFEWRSELPANDWERAWAEIAARGGDRRRRCGRRSESLPPDPRRTVDIAVSADGASWRIPCEGELPRGLRPILGAVEGLSATAPCARTRGEGPVPTVGELPCPGE